MVQVFADLSAMQDGILSIGGNDYNHIKNVLRMHPGDQLAVRPDTDGNEEGSGEYLFEIVSFSESTVNCRLLSVREAQTELPVRVLLFQGLPKADKMDQIVQKTVELGVTDIIPVQMHRSIVKLSGDKRKKRIDRWQLIAEAAAKQSRRSILPQVHDLCLMREALAMAARKPALPGRARCWNSCAPGRGSRFLWDRRAALRNRRLNWRGSRAPRRSPWAGGS